VLLKLSWVHGCWAACCALLRQAPWAPADREAPAAAAGGAPRPPFDTLLAALGPSAQPPVIVSVDIPSGGCCCSSLLASPCITSCMPTEPAASMPPQAGTWSRATPAAQASGQTCSCPSPRPSSAPATSKASRGAAWPAATALHRQ
jgi:hypothetical protein